MAMRRSLMMAQRSRVMAVAPARSFADVAPLQLHGISGRYATALYTVAGAKSKFLVGQELEGLAALRSQSPEFDRLVSDPTIPPTVVGGALDAVMDKGGYTPELKRFFGVLVENKRLGHLAKMTDDYAKLIAADRDELVATVTTAVKMTAAQTKKLEAALKAHPSIGNGKAVTVVPKVDAKIRGGMVVELDDVVVDLSVLTKLTQLKMALSG